MEVDKDGDCDESSKSIGVRPRVTGRLVAPTLATIPCGRAALAGSRGTAATTSLRVAVMREIPGTPVHSSEGTPKGFSMSTPPATSAGVNASGDTASPGASVESSPSVSEGDEADDSPLPKLGGRTAHELRWLGKTRVVRQGRTHGKQRRFDLDSAALFVEEALAAEELQEWLPVSVTHDCLIGIDGLYNPLLLGAVDDAKHLAVSAMGFAPGMWLNPLPGSWKGFGGGLSESAFAAADVGL